jgi:hypothetical protein
MVTANKAYEAARADAARFDAQYGTYQFSNAVENIGWANEWADGREAPKGIAYANWNDIGGYRDNRFSERARTLMKRLERLFEQLGVEIEWSDQVSTCDDCGNLIQTEPDSWGWQPEFVVGDGSITCAKCLESDGAEYLAGLEGSTEAAIVTVDPSEYGYVKVVDELERGWHEGQDADPRVIAKALHARGVSRFIFQVDDVGQFDASFSVWVHEDEAGKVTELKEVGSGTARRFIAKQTLKSV